MPPTRPLALVERGQRLTHTLRPFAAPRSKLDQATPLRRARPEGVLSAEVWLTLIDAGHPAYSPIIAALGNLAAPAFLTMANKLMICADFRSGDGGKTAVYILRWTHTRGKKGPWSEIYSVTVAEAASGRRDLDATASLV